MDVLDHLLSLAQISGSVDIQCLLQGSWQLSHQEHRAQARLHIVTQGKGYLHIDGQNAKLLHSGDMVFFPRAKGHQLSSHKTLNLPMQKIHSSQNGQFTIKQTGHEQPDVTLFCGGFHYEEKSDLMSQLPECLCLNLNHSALSSLIALLQDEARRTQEGSRSIINALSVVLITLIIRTHLAQQHTGTGVLYAWQDKRLGVLIEKIIQQPELSWKIEEMLPLVSLSRAQLMRLFKQNLETTPHNFVLNMRLQKAALLLKTGAQTVLNIALNCGFQSESHFTHAFRKHYGLSPKEYRQQKIE